MSDQQCHYHLKAYTEYMHMNAVCYSKQIIAPRSINLASQCWEEDKSTDPVPLLPVEERKAWRQ